MAAAQFLRDLIAAVPYRLYQVLTDNGIQFANRSCDTTALEHIFGRVCREHGIEHRPTKVRHPWSLEDQTTVQWTVVPTNGQIEWMNRTTKEGEADQKTIRWIVFLLNVKRFH